MLNEIIITIIDLLPVPSDSPNEKSESYFVYFYLHLSV